MRVLITGGCGFIGANVAAAVMRRGDELFVFDNLYRRGAAENLQWLRSQGAFEHLQSDIRNFDEVAAAFRSARPDVVFHFAGQVAMTTSIDEPRLDFEVNVIGGHNVLEATRRFAPAAVVAYSSTNKVYGDLDWITFDATETRYAARGFEAGMDESLPLQFASPYGCSKGAVDQYMLDYARIFGLRTIVFRHSSVFGGRQFSTYDQGWVGWFVSRALEARKSAAPFRISGNGKQVRDVLFVEDLVDCYFRAVENIDSCRGEAFNIGGGPANSLSLRELFSFLERELDVAMRYEQGPWRESDQKVFIADVGKAQRRFGWAPHTASADGLRLMIEWMQQHG